MYVTVDDNARACETTAVVRVCSREVKPKRGTVLTVSEIYHAGMGGGARPIAGEHLGGRLDRAGP